MRERYVAKYLRISDDDEDIGGRKLESDSIGNQRKMLEYYIKNHQELSKYPRKEFLDDGFSGVNFHRPGIQKLLKEAKENRVICIVVKDLSRFGRNYIEVGDYIEQIFPFMGIRFISISDHYDSFRNPAEMEIGFKNLIHDLYSRDLSVKVKSVKHLYQEQGRYSGGNVPYGYRKSDGNNMMYCPDPEAAQTVKRIFRLAADGMLPVKISEVLSRESVPTPGAYKNRMIKQNYILRNQKSNLWTPAQVREILQNEVYIGTYVCHKLTSVKPREMRRNDRSEYMKFENNHEPLISQELFWEAQRAIRSRGKRGIYQKEKNPHALKGKVKCGHCGYGMLRRGKRADIYYCHMGNACGSGMRIETGILEEAVIDIWKKMIGVRQEKERRMRHKEVQAISGLSRIREEKRLLEMKNDHCKVNRLKLYYQWKEGRIRKEEYLKKREELTEKEAECRRSLDTLKAGRAIEASRQFGFAAESDSGIFSDHQVLTKGLVDDFIERIDVYGADRIEIIWKFRDMIEQDNS